MQHWDKNGQRRNLILRIFSLLFVVQIFVAFSLKSSPGRNDSEASEIELNFSLDLKEVSGFGVDPTTGKIFAVSDRKPLLASFQISDQSIKDQRLVSFKKPIEDAFPFCSQQSGEFCRTQLDQLTSQWEGIQLMDENHIALLQEHSNSIVFLGAGKVKNVIGFHFSHPLLEVPKSSRQRAQGSLAEGFILMENGHVLVVKEFYPPAVVEMGPKGGEAMGYNKNRRASSATLAKFFEATGRKELQPLAVWSRSDDPKQQCDFSELTTNENGELFLMSQSCRQIIKVESLNPQLSYFNPDQVTKLPKKIKHPEALAVLNDGRFVVGDDHKRKRDNVFILKAR